MASLNAYLAEKRTAYTRLKQQWRQPDTRPQSIAAQVTAEGRSGIRRIRIRDFQLVSDSPPDFAGYGLGPGSPEIALGALASCIAHSWLIQAASQDVPLEALTVNVTGQIDPRGAHLDQDGIPPHPHGLAFEVHVVSPASDEAISRVRAEVERICPILNLLRRPQEIASAVTHVVPGESVEAAK